MSATPIDGAIISPASSAAFKIGANWKLGDGVLTGVEADLHGVSGNTDTKWQAALAEGGGNSFATYAQRTATLNYLGTTRFNGNLVHAGVNRHFDLLSAAEGRGEKRF